MIPEGPAVGGVFGEPAYYFWTTPGSLAVLDSVAVTGAYNNRLQVTWHSDLPAWRYYCSINSGPEFSCRPAGLILNGLPKGRVTVQIRALAGELAPDKGRRTWISWNTEGIAPIDPFISSDSPWSPILLG